MAASFFIFSICAASDTATMPCTDGLFLDLSRFNSMESMLPFDCTSKTYVMRPMLPIDTSQMASTTAPSAIFFSVSALKPSSSPMSRMRSRMSLWTNGCAFCAAGTSAAPFRPSGSHPAFPSR